MSPHQPSSVSYAQRAKPFAREVRFSLDPQHLFVDDGKKEKRIPYGEIAQARLVYEPKNFTQRCFRAVFTMRDGTTLSLTNLDWKTYFQFVHQDDFRPFVIGVIERAAAADPHLLCVAGRPIVLWALSALLGFVTTAIIGGGIVFAASKGAWLYALAATALLLPFAKLSYELFRRNKPMLFSPGEPPERLLPPLPRD